MHVEDTTSKEQMLREIILWASEVKQKSIEIQTKGRKNLYEGRTSNYTWIIINMGIFLRLSIIILIFAIET